MSERRIRSDETFKHVGAATLPSDLQTRRTIPMTADSSESFLFGELSLSAGVEVRGAWVVIVHGSVK